MNKALPKLGRPFKAGSARNKYLKFYLTDSELLSFEHLENNVKIYYLSHGLKYNRADHFRKFLFMFDDVNILNSICNFKNSHNPFFDPILKR